jgi:hypothetical protein
MSQAGCGAEVTRRWCDMVMRGRRLLEKEMGCARLIAEQKKSVVLVYLLFSAMMHLSRVLVSIGCA